VITPAPSRRSGLPSFAAGITTWDARAAGRAAAFAALGMLLAWLVTAATDEGGVAWSERASRVLPLSPACAAWGTWLGQARGWAKGEGRAMACLGRSPLATSASSILGGAMVAWTLALAILLVGRIDVAGFFPVARAPHAFVSTGASDFVEVATGLHIHADGSISGASPGEAPEPSSSLVPPGGRVAAALTSALAGLGLPLLVARTGKAPRFERAALLALALAASVLLFHAAAAHLVGAMASVLPSLLLLVWAGVRMGSGSRAHF
jgi:hypothetical protein